MWFFFFFMENRFLRFVGPIFGTYKCKPVSSLFHKKTENFKIDFPPRHFFFRKKKISCKILEINEKKWNLGENQFLVVFFVQNRPEIFFFNLFPKKDRFFFYLFFCWKKTAKSIFRHETKKKNEFRQKKMFFQKLCKLCWKNYFWCQTIILGRKIEFSFCLFFTRTWFRAVYQRLPKHWK